MEARGNAIEASQGAGRQDFWSLQTFTRAQPHLAGCQPFTQLPLVTAILQPFDKLCMIARPSELSAIG